MLFIQQFPSFLFLTIQCSQSVHSIVLENFLQLHFGGKNTTTSKIRENLPEKIVISTKKPLKIEYLLLMTWNFAGRRKPLTHAKL